VLIYGNPQTSIVYQESLKSAQKHLIPLEEFNNTDVYKKYPIYKPSLDQQALYEPSGGVI